jgi:1-aminocyclopropane-1-carboxylate deaminase/D-cysteine desulfhydrase-like pyridoxal-dependent ACC family enzyme
LGISLYMKRDDLTDPGMGGNKLRKLEYYLFDAKAKGATTLLTVGGVQTNHGRLTAAVAAKYGLKCAIVAIDEYPGEVSSNLLLDRLMGAEVFLSKLKNDIPYEDQLNEAVDQVRSQYEAAGETVYYIPMGGSGEVGVPGYYDCAMELAAQAGSIGISGSKIFVAVGSMGTYMGLFTGIRNEGLNLTLKGIAIAPFYKDPAAHALAYYEKVRNYYNLPNKGDLEDFDISSDYTYGAYNNPVKEVREAVYYMARKEGILLDPCYTGKAFCGLLDLVKKGGIAQGETVIFLHTGGQPGLNGPNHRVAMEAELLDGIHLL